MTMDKDDGKQMRIQILATKEGIGSAGRAVAVTRERTRELADIGRGQGAEALLICPATEEITGEGFDLVIGARFRPGLDEDAVFWRQHRIADEIHHALKVEALVLDLDVSLGGFVKGIEWIVASPYRDELGIRGG